MTDKQIIIDGCDVSKCKYFSKYQKIVRNNECIVDIQNACVEEIETKPCWQEHNCYFKDWQRKEQECEEWKHQAELGIDTTNRLTKELEEKEQECEELKKELILKEVANIELSDEVKKYSKAIDEIEEIADNNYEIAEMEQIFLIIGGLDV